MSLKVSVCIYCWKVLTSKVTSNLDFLVWSVSTDVHSVTSVHTLWQTERILMAESMSAKMWYLWSLFFIFVVTTVKTLVL